MKAVKLTIIISALFLVLVSTKDKSNENKQPTDAFQPPDQIRSTAVDTKPTHISEMIIGNPNTVVKDRNYLWKNFESHKYERPFTHGVVGPQWEVPLQEKKTDFIHISSPMPKPDIIRKIKAEELPPITYSHSSFDMPLRKDVIQTDIPLAKIRTVEENIDPRFPPKKPVEKVKATVYHGTGSVDEKVVIGPTSFLEQPTENEHHEHSENQNKHNSNEKVDLKKVQKEKEETLGIASTADKKVTEMIYKITNNPAEDSKMIIPVELINKYEDPDIKIHQDNAALKEKFARIRNTPAGVRAAHTLRKLP